MSENKSSITKFLDSAIFVFIIIFLLSISNSIFVNQVGYYGALILILIKAAVTKKNQFSKTGLEFAFVWYILAEILSTIFSSDFAASFHNLLKHVLLIPIIYTIIASVNNYKDAKNVFKIYIGGTIITVFIYLYFSLQFYLKDLYGITESGPSIFQYPITASEIISFTVIFLFAFLVNEKTSIRNKLLLLIGFVLSTLALFSTYKRTGWMGAAAGILIVLILKKQWKIITAGLVLVLIFLVIQKNISQVNIYSLKSEKAKFIQTINTEGKAYDSFKLGDLLIVSDYNKGLLVFKDSSLIKSFELPSAVINFFHWKDDYYLSGLVDSRFILFKKVNDDLKEMGELFSPGYTCSQAVANENFYILDKDSGLTIFTNPENLHQKIHYPLFASTSQIYVDSTYLLLTNPETGYNFFRLKNGLPERTAFIKDSLKNNFVYYSSNYLFIESSQGLDIYKIDSLGISYINNLSTIKFIIQMDNETEKYFASLQDGNVYVIEKNDAKKFYISNKISLGYRASSINVFNDSLFVSRVENKKSRLLGIFDPYHPSNFTRIALWKAGIKIFKDHPIVGVGDIDLANYYKQYKQPYNKEIQGHMHNNFIHVLVTLGLFGLLSVVFLFYKMIAIDLKIFNQSKNMPFVSSYALGTIAAFCGFLVSGLTELNFWDHEITTLIWFTFGLNIAFFRSIKPDKKIS